MAIRYCFVHEIGWYYHARTSECRDYPYPEDEHTQDCIDGKEKCH